MLDEKTIAVMRLCSRGSVEGTLRFPDVVKKLVEAGVESYHADIYRHEKTYYMPGGSSHLEPEKDLPLFAVAHTFDMDGVKTAIRRVQKAETSYIEFMDQISMAGVAQYWVYLTGKKAVYVGRRGDAWTELFPDAPLSKND
jgi:uncharacterized protein YbcV (DUF1398 family)